MMKKHITWLMMALLMAPALVAGTLGDDDDNDKGSAARPGIRRLYPDRERAKAMKRLQEQLSRHAEAKADPWDTDGELWGTVDVPIVAVKDSTAVVGHHPGERHRLSWRDEPVTVSRDILMTFMAENDGEIRSKYVTGDVTDNEVYFAFTMTDSLPGPLRLCVNYCADAPFLYDQLTFNVDGFDYTFFPAGTQQGRDANGLCWQHSDDELHVMHRDLVYALAHGQWVLLKLTDSNGVSHVKVLTDGQCDDFANTLALYRLLGGVW